MSLSNNNHKKSKNNYPRPYIRAKTDNEVKQYPSFWESCDYPKSTKDEGVDIPERRYLKVPEK